MVGAHGVEPDGGFTARLGGGAARDHGPARLCRTEEGQRVRGAGGHHAGQRLDPPHGQLPELRDVTWSRVRSGREEDAAGDQPFGPPAGVAAPQLVEPAQREGRAREQDRGKGVLSDDQQLPEASMPEPSRHATRAALERAVQVEPLEKERGGGSEGDDREQRGAERPAEHAPVEGEDDAALRGEPVEGQPGDEHRAEAAREGQQQGLEEQRAQGPGARGAQRGTHGELASACHGAAQGQVGQVGAGDEQHEAGEADQQAEKAPAVLGNHGIVERDRAPRALGVERGVLRSEPATKDGDEGVRLRAETLLERRPIRLSVVELRSRVSSGVRPSGLKTSTDPRWRQSLKSSGSTPTIS